MKAITVKEPWASLLISGHKTIETRTWATEHRGWLAVHTARKPDGPACRWMLEAHHQLIPPMGYQAGVILGVMRVADCRRLTAEDEPAAWCDCGGLWGLIVDAVVPLAEPLPARGHLMLWDLDGEQAAGCWAAIEAWERRACTA